MIGAAVCVVVAVAITADLGGVRGPEPAAYLFAVCLGALMLVRRRFPVLALVATAAGLLAYYWVGFPPIGLALPVAAALYSAAEAGRLRIAILTAAALVLISTGFRAAQGENPAYLFGFELASTVAIMVAAIALGDSVRGRRLLRAEREAEARRRVEAERLRIARDLHDVLAHTLAVVSVQSAVASEAVHDDPAATDAALTTIRAATDEAFRELHATLDALRPDAAPTGSVRDLDALVAATGHSGLPVDVRVEGDPVPLPVVVDTTAYRIVREALTNTLRHAHARRAEVLVSYGPDRLGLTISDDGRGGEPTPGRGITGMRERATLLGGKVAVGPRPGGFAVTAELPL